MSAATMRVGRCRSGERLTQCTGANNFWGEPGHGPCRKDEEIGLEVTCSGGTPTTRSTCGLRTFHGEREVAKVHTSVGTWGGEGSGRPHGVENIFDDSVLTMWHANDATPREGAKVSTAIGRPHGPQRHRTTPQLSREGAHYVARERRHSYPGRGLR